MAVPPMVQCTLHDFWPIRLRGSCLQSSSALPVASLTPQQRAKLSVLERLGPALWSDILEYVDLETKLTLKYLCKEWRKMMLLPDAWRRFELTSNFGADGCPTYLLSTVIGDRFMPGIGNVIGICQGKIVHLNLPTSSPVNEDKYPLQLAEVLGANLPNLKSFSAETQITSTLLNYYLPLMSNLKSLRLLEIRDYSSVPKPHWPGLGELNLPASLEELTIHDAEFPEDFKCDSASKLRSLELKAINAPTEELKLEGCDLRREPFASAGGAGLDHDIDPAEDGDWEHQLHDFKSLEDLQLCHCIVDLPGRLPSSLKALSMQDCEVTDGTLFEWLSSGIPNLQRLYLSQTTGPTWPFLSYLLSKARTTMNHKREVPANLKSLIVEWWISNSWPSGSMFTRDALKSILQQHGATLEDLTLVEDDMPNECTADIATFCLLLSSLHLESTKLRVGSLNLMLFELSHDLKKLQVKYIDNADGDLIKGLEKLCDFRNIDHSL